jgi:arsenate reductase
MRVLFLCTHNSARSQMAEGLLRHAAPAAAVASAGTEATRVHPLAVAALARRGIDIRGQYSKTIAALAAREFDYVITVCDAAAQACPVFPGPAVRFHWSLPDPTAVGGDDDARSAAFEATARDLEARIGDFLAALPAPR